jgi:predicted deacylase
MVSKRRGFRIGTERVRRGESREVRLELSSSYTGDAISLPVHVLRGKKPGPVVVVTAAVHGDEINGTGILRFHVSPGEIVDAGRPLATNVSVFGQAQSVLISPQDGIVLGMTTLPAVKPGEPVCQIAIPTRSIKRIRRSLEKSSAGKVYQRMREDFASSVTVSETGS